MSDLTSLYQKFSKAQIEIDNHETDLYVKDNNETRKIIEEYEKERSVSVYFETFKDQKNHETWLDIPFGYVFKWKEKLIS